MDVVTIKLEREYKFMWEVHFPALGSKAILFGTNHILEDDISDDLFKIIEWSDRVVIEHRLVLEDDAEDRMPFCRDVLEQGRIEIIQGLIEPYFPMIRIHDLRVDETVSIIQRAGRLILGAIFESDRWVHDHCLGSGVVLEYAEILKEKDRNIVDFYIEYLRGLENLDEVADGMRRSIDLYWSGDTEMSNGFREMSFYERGITDRSKVMFSSLIYNLMIKNGRCALFFGALHALEIVQFLKGIQDGHNDAMGINEEIINDLEVRKIG